MTDRARGVTTTLRYALFLAIVTLLVGGLFIGVGELVETQQERAIGSQLDTVGNDFAADLTLAARLAGTGEANTSVTVRSSLPDAVAGSQYRIEIRNVTTGDTLRYELTLRSENPEILTTVVFRPAVDVQETSVSGGQLRITYDGSAVEVQDG